MECSLGEEDEEFVEWSYSLNPYSNGMLTWIRQGQWYDLATYSLNPYSNGMLTWVWNAGKRLKHMES